jgi:hypothetical protein
MRSKAGRRPFAVGCFMLLSALAAGEAFADAVRAGVVVPAGQPAPVITDNGQGYTPGTYGVGTIHLDYAFVGMAFPAGQFATFELQLGAFASEGGRVTYPASLEFEQVGSDGIVLTPATSELSVSGVGWAGSVLVSIAISADAANDPDLDDDGDVIVGHLKLVGGKLKAPTDVIVKIRLVHPTECLKAYSFVTDAELETVITTLSVNTTVNRTQDKVNGSNPGSLSHNVMVVNTCPSAETFDLRIALDPWFETQGANAVSTFSTAGEVDPAAFDMALFGTATKTGLDMCLPGVSVPGGTTYLAAVHMSLTKGAASQLPAPQVFSGFGGTLTAPGTSCTGEVLKSIVLALPFSIQ